MTPDVPLLQRLSIALGLISALSAIFSFVYSSTHKVEEPTIQTRIEALSRIEDSLKDLQSFVENQKTNLGETEHKIEALTSQKEEIEKVLQIDRPHAEALVNSLNHRSFWQTIGDNLTVFAMGCASSLAVVVFVSWFNNRKRRREEKSS